MLKHLQKPSLFLIAILFAIGAKSQEINLQTAIKEAKNQDYDEALKYIKKAQKHDETKNQAKTWYWRAKIMAGITKADDSATKNLTDSSLRKGLNAIDKCRKLDKEDNYKRKVLAIKAELSTPAYIQATKAYRNKKWQRAFELFKIAGRSRFQLMVAAAKRKKDEDETLREGFQKLEQVDTTAFDALYYAAISAEQLGKDSVALRYFQQVAPTGFYKGDATLRISDIYDRQGKETKMLETINKGLERYPSHKKLIRKRAQYYIDKEKYKKAEKSIRKAIKAQEGNKKEKKELKLLLGGIYQTLYKDFKKDSAKLAKKYFEKAEKNYQAAIGKDSTQFSALQNLGSLYLNKGNEIYQNGKQKKNKMYQNGKKKKAEKKWKKVKKKAEKKWKKAIPYLEKALELQNRNTTVAKSLMRLYNNLNRPKDYKRVKKTAGFK